MDVFSYKYLFPFECVPARSRILIYGAGTLGQEYLKQILITDYCTVVGFIDKNHSAYPAMAVPVYAPEEIHRLSFDYVVIALRVSFALNEIKRVLEAQGVEGKKIRYVLERSNILPMIISEQNEADEKQIYAYESSSLSFALYLGGGIGDMINQKRFVAELIKLVPTAQIDLYIVKNEKFMQWLYSDYPKIKNIVMDLGIQYEKRKKKYSISISVIASVFLQVDHFMPEKFDGEYDDFRERVERLRERCRDEGLSILVPNGVAFRRRIYQGVNCYTWFNYGDAFSIRDYHVTIPFLEEDKLKFEQLGLKKYVTVNAGNGACGDGKQVAKSWPTDRFCETISRLKEHHPNLQIVQIGAAGETPLSNADCCFLGKGFGLIAWILRHAILHVDIEGGLVHLASQIGTKCIVLFGPTSMEYNAYENNINIREGSCRNCYGLYLDSNRCARHMEEPECMYSITPDMVIQEIEQYMSTLPL